MSGFELNKVIASILLASLIAMLVGFLANILYKPKLQPEKRGYSINVTSDPSQRAGGQQEEKIDIAALMENANAEAGEKIISKCTAACHTIKKGEPGRIGPNLWGVAGSEKGKIPGYTFSAAINKLGGIWDDESLFHFINHPGKYAPGTKMSFVGLSKAEDIVNVIAFLKTLKDS